MYGLNDVADVKIVADTARLRIRHLHEGDAPFILDLLNQPTFLRFIGDKGVRTLDDARAYIVSMAINNYAAHGHGLYLVEETETGLPAGTCGILRKPTLPHPDIGYAFLPAFWGRGYALEAAAAIMTHAVALGIERLCAVVDPQNESSIKLLVKLGMHRSGQVQFNPNDIVLELFEIRLPG
jgi:[ribosomal protein S5]-alanine N-acetyltransferase